MAVADLSDVLDPGAIKSNPLAPSGASPTSDAAPASKPDEPPKKEAPPEKRPPPPTAGEGVATEAAARQNQIIEAQNMRFRPPDMKLPEKPPPRDEFGPRMWAALAIGVAALGSRMTQQPITAALNGAAGALQGYQEGKMEDFDRSMKVWERESQNAITLANYQKDVYKSILDESHYAQRTNLQAGEAKDYVRDHATEAKLKAAFIAHGDTIALQTLENEGVPGVAKLQNFREEKIDSLKQATSKMSAQGQSVALWHQKQAAFEEENHRKPNAVENLNLYTESMHEAGADVKGKAAQGLAPEQVRPIAEAVARGDMAFPAGRTLNLPGWAGVITEAQKINPGISQDVFPTIQKDKADLETGQSSRNLQSFKAVAQHLVFLQQLADKLPENADVQMANKVTAALNAQFGGTEVSTFEAARNLVGPELMKAVVAGPTAVKDREDAKNAFSTAMNKKQMQEAIDATKRLVAGQLDAAEDRHRTLKEYRPAEHAAYFEGPWRNVFQPERQKQDALSSTARAPTGGEGSSEKNPKHVSDMAEALNYP